MCMHPHRCASDSAQAICEAIAHQHVEGRQYVFVCDASAPAHVRAVAAAAAQLHSVIPCLLAGTAVR